MSDVRIVLTDSENRLLPLAWGVAGGNVTTSNLLVDKSTGSNSGYVGISNSNIAINSNQANTTYSFSATNNGSIEFTANNISMNGTDTNASGTNLFISFNNAYVDAPVTINNTTTFNANTIFSHNSNTQFNSAMTTFDNEGFATQFNTNNVSKDTLSSKTNESIVEINSSINLTPAHLTINPASRIDVDRTVLRTETTIFTNLQYIKDTPSYTFTSNANVASIPNGTLTNVLNVPISQVIDATALDDNAVVEVKLYHTEGLAPDQAELGTLYVELYESVSDNSSGCYLIEDTNMIQTHTVTNYPAIRLQNLLFTFSFGTTLTTNCSFRLWANPVNSLTNQEITAVINIYDAETAGSGSGGGIDNTNLYVPYDNTLTYAVGDVVYYNGYIYECHTAVTVPENFDSNKWTQTSVTAELSTIVKYINSLEDLTNVQF